MGLSKLQYTTASTVRSVQIIDIARDREMRRTSYGIEGFAVYWAQDYQYFILSRVSRDDYSKVYIARRYYVMPSMKRV